VASCGYPGFDFYAVRDLAFNFLVHFLWKCVTLLLAMIRLCWEGDFGQGCVRAREDGRGPSSYG